MSKDVHLSADFSDIPAQGLLVLGFSAGADSTALAGCLLENFPKERIVLAHVNHLLRGEEAMRDEAAAESFAKAHGVRFALLREDIKARAASRGQNLEDCGREVRYSFFHSLATGENDRILTAHHAGDQAETLLLNLVRGAGLSGLCGIARKRGKILRPLLKASREDIERYCCEKGFPYVCDSTNESTDFVRNRLRHQVLPVLKELDGEVEAHLCRTTGRLSLLRDYVQQQAQELLLSCKVQGGLSCEGLLKAHPALQREALRLFLLGNGCGRLSERHIDGVQALLSQGGGLSLPGRYARCYRGVLQLLSPKESGRSGLSGELCVSVELLDFPQKVSLGQGKEMLFQLEELPFSKETGKNKGKIHNLLFKNSLDYDKIVGKCEVRNRRAGDRFAPAGRGISKPLKQLFAELDISPVRRATALLFCVEGKPAFCEYLGVDRAFSITPETRNALVIRILDEGKRSG